MKVKSDGIEFGVFLRQRVLTDGDDTPEELEEKRRKAIAAANSEDGDDSNGGADGDHEGKLLTGEERSDGIFFFYPV